MVDEPQVDATYLTRNRLIAAAAAFPLLFPPLVVAVGVWTGTLLMALPTFHLVTFGVVLSALAYERNPAPRRRRVRARRDDDGIVIEGESGAVLRRIPKEKILGGILLPRPGKPPIVRVQTKGRLMPRAEFEVESIGQGRVLLERLALDASRHLSTWTTPSHLSNRPGLVWAFAGIVFCLGGFASAFHRVPHALFPPTFFVMALVAAVGLVAFAVPGKIQVGTDGVLITWLTRKQFLRHSEIARVHLTHPSSGGYSKIKVLAITLLDGRIVDVPLSVGMSRHEADAVVERMTEARLAAASGTRETGPEVRLERGALSLSEWVRHLRAMGAGATTTLRDAPVHADALWDVVLDAKKPAQLRAAAAVALTSVLDADGRARLRVAAETTAAPKLRVAFEAAAAGNDLEAALSELDPDEAGSKTDRRRTA